MQLNAPWGELFGRSLADWSGPRGAAVVGSGADEGSGRTRTAPMLCARVAAFLLEASRARGRWIASCETRHFFRPPRGNGLNAMPVIVHPP